MRRLRASNAETARVRDLVSLQAELFPPDAPPPGVRRWLRDVGRERVNDLFRLRIALCRANPGMDRTAARDLLERWRKSRSELRTRAPITVAELAIGGAELKELGLSPGPRFGRILDALLERVLDDPSLNTPERLRSIVLREFAS